MITLGIIRHSKSDWSLLFHIVPKTKGRGWRSCGDLRCLNNISKDDRYPILNMQDRSAMLEGKTIFTKIHLILGFHHIPVNKADISKDIGYNHVWPH